MSELKLSHLDAVGMPAMVDVTGKDDSVRSARAQARVWLPFEVRLALDGDEIRAPKGAVVQTAILAGTMAAKKTWDLIPLCHPLLLGKISFAHLFEGEELVLECTVACNGKTGVEMEALTAVSVAALTVYDMAKALSHDIEIRSIRLLGKRGGKSDMGEVI
ncbi:MAG: hypothetical protein RL318_2641 [Fibrobacterota bacterium]|jgi:cyclic pyranopterin phosphate synthase